MEQERVVEVRVVMAGRRSTVSALWHFIVWSKAEPAGAPADEDG